MIINLSKNKLVTGVFKDFKTFVKINDIDNPTIDDVLEFCNVSGYEVSGGESVLLLDCTIGVKFEDGKIIFY